MTISLYQPKPLETPLRQRLLNRAAPLHERLAGNYQQPTDWQAGADSLNRLERWSKLIGAGIPGQFERRLDQDNLSLSQLSYILSDDFQFADPPAQAPRWLGLLEATLVENATVLLDLQGLPEEATLPYRFIKPQQPVLFEEVLAGFVRVALRELKEKTGSAFDLLSEQAQRGLEVSLLSDLTPLTTSVLSEEFLKYRLSQPSSLLFTLRQPSSGIPSRKVYRKFVQNLLRDGWVNLFEKYPVLARLLGILLSDWVEATTECLTHLQADFPALKARFSLATPCLAGYESSVSDAHNGHRSVVILTFEDATKLVYKPRDLGAEEAYATFLDWLNRQSLSLDLKTYQILNQGTHGWVEFVQAGPCQDVDEVAAFYRRAGMLLAVFYLLGTVDCHQENIIACGAYPIMIDAEAVMSYQVKTLTLSQGEEQSGLDLGYEYLEESVLRTHLLPFWVKNGLGTYSDISGLSLGRPIETQSYTRRVWEHINTDLLRKIDQTVTAAAEPDSNVPRLNEVAVSPAPYLSMVVEGFCEVYRLFMSRRSEMLKPDGALTLCENREIRLIFRATQTYAGLLYNTYHPSVLSNGADRSIELDVLSRGLLNEDTERFWQMLEAELVAMERGDIPLFNCLSDTNALYMANGQTLSGWAEQSAYGAVRQRLAGLSQEDLTRQIHFIKNSFYTVQANPQSLQAPVSSSITNFEAEPTTPSYLLAQACNIASRLRLEAVVTKNGGLTWLAPELLPDGQIYSYKVLSQSLYSGTSGIALFLAALYRVTGETSYRQMSLAALQATRSLLKSQSTLHQLVRFTGIGGSFGVGSLVYALTRVGELLDDPTLLDDAQHFATLITPTMIAADRSYDVMLGSAGAILALLALYRVRPHNRWLETATRCGDHLLATRLSRPQNLAGWATYAHNPYLSVSGFAHGASGIGLALSKLAQVTARTDFAQAARQAFEFEASRFDPERQNWASLLVENDPAPFYGVAWCHGAVGIGLARLALLSASEDASSFRFQQEIQTALQTTLKTGLHSFDQLCCGTAGRVELLTMAAQALNRPDLLATARVWAGQMIKRAGENDGHYRFLADTSIEVSAPSLFQGLAGVGYTLLRTAEPTCVPSVAVWE